MVVAASAGPAEMVAVFGAASKSSPSAEKHANDVRVGDGEVIRDAVRAGGGVVGHAHGGVFRSVGHERTRARRALFKITRTSGAKSAETAFPSASTRSKPNAPSAPATRSGFAEASKRTAATSPGTTVTVNASTVAPAVPGDVCVTVTA